VPVLLEGLDARVQVDANVAEGIDQNVEQVGAVSLVVRRAEMDLRLFAERGPDDALAGVPGTVFPPLRVDGDARQRSDQTSLQSTRVAFALSWMPAPTSRNASACSNRTASMPRCLSASAVVVPAMPPPAIRILRSCLIKIPPDGLPAVAPTAAISRIATHSEPGATVTATSVRPVPADPPSPEHREFHACRGGGVVNCFTIGLQIRSCGQLHRAARSGPPEAAHVISRQMPGTVAGDAHGGAHAATASRRG
jgi:hypothetical protein